MLKCPFHFPTRGCRSFIIQTRTLLPSDVILSRKINKILGIHPKPLWGAYSAPTDPLAGLRRSTFNKRVDSGIKREQDERGEDEGSGPCLNA